MPGMITVADHGGGITVNPGGTGIKVIGAEAAVMIGARIASHGNREIPMVGAIVATGARRGTVEANSKMVTVNTGRRADSITAVTVRTIVDTGAIGTTGIQTNHASREVPGIGAAKAAMIVATGAQAAAANGVKTAGARISDSVGAAMIVTMTALDAKIVVVPTKMNHAITTTTGAATRAMPGAVLSVTIIGVATGAAMSAVAITIAGMIGAARTVAGIARTIRSGGMIGAVAVERRIPSFPKPSMRRILQRSRGVSLKFSRRRCPRMWHGTWFMPDR